MADIVVIDSEETVRSTVVAILRSAGYQVRATGRFEEALDLLRGSAADLVLTNVYLKGVTGHDAMKILKGEFPSLPVLMVSGLPDEDVISEWSDTVGFDVFPKPFKRLELLKKVREMLPAEPH